MNLEAATISYMPASTFCLGGECWEDVGYYYPKTFKLRRTDKGNLIWTLNWRATLFAQRFTSPEEVMAAIRNIGLIHLKRKNPDARFYYFKEGDLGT